jgi:hypothetical protein
VLITLGLVSSLTAQEPAKLWRAGMIGLDTSHVPAFTRIFNTAMPDSDMAGVKVVVGYPGGTDIPASRDRVEKFTEQIRGMGVEIVDSIPALLEKVDVVLLESVDGRIHLQEARQVIEAGKPLFIDKPLAGSLSDAVAIYELAKKHNVPFFSSSSSRFGEETQKLKQSEEVGKIVGVSTWGSMSYQEGTPDLFFYGIHGVEKLFTLMGPGCVTVTRVQGKDADLVTGLWNDGRVGSYRGIRRGASSSGTVIFGSNAIVQPASSGKYEDLCAAIGRFFKTGHPPVAAEETLEILAFMEAADESKRRNGAPVSVEEVLAKAKAEAVAKLNDAAQ